MNDQLMMLGLGFVIGAVGRSLVNLWKRNKDEIARTLDSADDKIAAKLGVTVPDGFQTAWHEIVHGAVEYVDRFASDGRFWREVIRAIVAKDPSKAVMLQAELSNLSWDKGIAAVEAVMSPELKAVVNTVKEELAVKVAKANVASTGTAPAIAQEPEKVEQEIRAAIRVVAPAHKPEEGPVTKSRIEQMILESQERQKKLEAKK